MLAISPKYYQAGGALSGQLQDASAGLSKQLATNGALWAWNPQMEQWQAVHELAAGETIWGLLPSWYGSQSLTLVHAVRDVPQNLAILGSDAAQAFPGDVILVPNLAAPWTGPPPTPTSTTDPTLATAATAATTAATAATTAATAQTVANTGDETNGEQAITNGNGAAPLAKTNGASWWTPGRTAGVAVGGAVVVAGLAYYLGRR